MITFYLVRHGEPAFPHGKHLCLGRTDIPLSDRGHMQAMEAAKNLAGKNLPVFCSPQRRALETAFYFGEAVVLEGLRERDMGVWDGLSFEEIRANYPELYARRQFDKSLLPEGAESVQAVRQRFEKELRKIAAQCEDEAILVTHSGVMELFFGITKPDYCSITVVSWDS